MNDKDKIKDLIERCVENVIPSKKELGELLLSGKKLNIYFGIDPTGIKIHLGHAMPLRKLQLLSDLGHKVTFLIGDFTATIGDTSDKEGERPVLTREEIEKNFATYKKQAEKVLDFTNIEVKFNSEWLKKLTFGEVLFLAGHFSVNDFVSRELIRKRLDEGKRVSLPEVLYPLMQGYDSYHLNTDIQLGGTDQTFNMQAGRKLNKVLGKKESFIIANGFLLGTDGRKMSKTWGNAIWLDDKPEEIYGKVMSIKDELIIEYFKFGTSVSLGEIDEIKKKLEKSDNPMEIKKRLAEKIIEELYSEKEVVMAGEHFEKTIQQKQVVGDVMTVVVGKKELSVDELMEIVVDKGLVESKSQFRRLIEQGAVYVDEKRLDGDVIQLTKEVVVRIGRRRYLKLVK
ncbi:tyrosine--tRNA ligase [Patescibacteria group bacterium]|nr:tyrosine--tRNA ligase [Patescibacteria group bacterium]MBU1256680.1 tyrosine--tRNA ligase [Patescibacteria group bacterium]